MCFHLPHISSSSSQPPSPDRLLRLRRPAALLLPGGVHLDVPGGRAALHHAGGGFRERALTQALLLHGGLRRSRADRGRLGRGGLPQLRNGPNVSWMGFCFVILNMNILTEYVTNNDL